jgi:hypothetical protein
MGFFLIFKVQQFRINQETRYYIKRDIPMNQLVIISVDSKNELELDWKHRKEFRYKGIVYDVVKKETVNGQTTLFYCLTDELATTLFSELDELIEKNKDAKDNDWLKNIYEHFLSGIYSMPQKLIWTLFPTDSKISYAYFYHYSSPVFDITGPPPKVV